MSLIFLTSFLRRSRAKKWNSDDSDEAEDSDRASSDGAAEEPEDAAESAASSNENEVVASSRDEKLGRGARTRANVGLIVQAVIALLTIQQTKIRKQIKKSAPKSSNHPSSEA